MHGIDPNGTECSQPRTEQWGADWTEPVTHMRIFTWGQGQRSRPRELSSSNSAWAHGMACIIVAMSATADSASDPGPSNNSE
jgi:hypothetical protein